MRNLLAACLVIGVVSTYTESGAETNPLMFARSASVQSLLDLDAANKAQPRSPADVSDSNRMTGTPLHRATSNNNAELAEFQVAGGAELDPKYRNFGPPLIAVSQKGSLEVAQSGRVRAISCGYGRIDAPAGAFDACASTDWPPPVEVDVALVLAVDVSRSMSPSEQTLQRGGYVAAFRNPRFVEAVESGLLGRIAVTYLEWAGIGHQSVVIPWTIIDDLDDSHAFAAALQDAPLVAAPGTSISSGLMRARDLLMDVPAIARRHVIDISGDGANNHGPSPTAVRALLLAEGVVINGLPIALPSSEEAGESPRFNSDRVRAYYKNCVIGGLGAFLISVDDIATFGLAVRRKLILEVASALPGLWAVFGEAGAADYDCSGPGERSDR